MIISVNSTGLIIIAGALSYTPNWAPPSTPKSGGKYSYFMDGLGEAYIIQILLETVLPAFCLSIRGSVSY